MNITVDRKAIENDALANLVFTQIKQVADEDSCIYYKFPFFRGDIECENVEAKLLLLSPLYGIFFFDLESKGVFDDLSMERVDNLYTEISSRIKKFPSLRQGRGLKYDITSIVVGNYDNQEFDGYILCKVDDVAELIMARGCGAAIPTEDFRLLVGSIEGTARMITKKERKTIRPNTKAQALDDIQNHIANFDQRQKEIAIIDVNLPQRIRGLAGSGIYFQDKSL